MFFDKLKEYEILLASNSPRRRNLIKGLDLNVTIMDNPDQEEKFPEDLELRKVPEFLALQKANGINVGKKQILITADTIVLLDNRVVGKPDNEEDAIRLLHMLSGRMHEVITGIYLSARGVSKSFSVSTNVYFRSLLSEEIEYYVKKFRPLDKAGAYGIQEWIGFIGVERIEGSYFNVMGLPVQTLYQELCKLVDLSEK